MLEKKHYNLSELKWVPVREGIRRKGITGKECTIVYNEVSPNHEVMPHRHPHEQLAYIAEGECNYYVDGVCYKLTTGSILYVPPNVEHYIEVTGKKPVINIDIFSPARPEAANNTKEQC